MRYSYGLLGLAALAAASDVHDLTQSSFDGFIKEHDLVLAEFFAPWCGHCKALAPEYEDAATTLKDKNIALAKVDCTVEQDLCQKYGIEGYPTLKVFRGLDVVTPYAGARKAPAIVSYMTKQSMPAVTQLQTATELEAFKTADKVVLVGFFDKGDKTSNATFGEVAEEQRDSFMFAATSDAELAKAEGVKQPAIVLYKAFDEGKNTFEKKFTKEAITEFAQVASMPLIGEVSPETYANYMAGGLPLAYIFAETPEERESLAKTLKPAAEKHRGKVNVATIDAQAFGQHGQNLNLEVGKWPAFAIQDTKNHQKYPYPSQGNVKDLSEKKIGQFLDDFVAGKLEPSIKSEPIPDKQDGPVTIVVAKNYQDVVIKNDKDVLVEFYAPWCGHCKALAPKYDELGQLFKAHSDKVVIAKVDATANDVPDEIEGFPTIKLFPAGSKDSPVDYAGSRSVEDLAAFVRDNGAHKVDVMGEGSSPAVEMETDHMPRQAPAATPSPASEPASASGESVAEKVKDAAGKVKDMILEDDDMEEHDEL
ncbi:protein disulfide isomerase [Piedraia hortae CBS 480.64]|uniref:Protein disulfide-isomerase n=1 Tax=Piedraia hortae CBS 480.64 TaxID=1314780 RepID=A0A6A7C401_9PEZI|nr:protein disulfide isomerase [Piedraia hortae CBS 480.64]